MATLVQQIRDYIKVISDRTASGLAVNLDSVESLIAATNALVTPFNRTGTIAGMLCNDANYHTVETPAAASGKLALYQFRATVTTEPFYVKISYDDGATWSDEITVPAGCVEEVIGSFAATAFEFKMASGAVTVMGKYFYTV